MLLSPSSRRGSYSIPVHTNLQSVRRGPDSNGGSLCCHICTSYPMYFVKLDYDEWISIMERIPKSSMKEVSSKDESGKTLVTISSVGDDRAILLGLSMIGFSLLMYFLFGILMVNPCLRSNWTEESNCTVIQASFLDELEDSANEFKFPCLNVTVNLSRPHNKAQLAILYYNEDALNLPFKCFYRPKYRQNTSDVQEEAQRIYKVFLMTNEPFTCFSSQNEYHLGYTDPGDAILTRKCNRQQVMQYMSMSTLMLVGGVVTIGLVRLNQHLSHMVAQSSKDRAKPE